MTLTSVSAWLTSSITLARNPASTLAEIQNRVDSMTDALSEGGHRLAGDVSRTAMQINMFRSLQRPLPDWSPEQARDPEKTLRQLAVQVFQQVAKDDAALRALQASGEVFVEGTAETKTDVVKTFNAEHVRKKVKYYFDEADEEYFWGSGRIRDSADLKWRTDAALGDIKSDLERVFGVTFDFYTIDDFNLEPIEEAVLRRLSELGRLVD